MLTAARTFADDLATPLTRPRWLSLLGSPASGKTMLARMVYRQASAFADRYPSMESGRSRRCCFRSWPKMLAALRDGEFRPFNDLCGEWFLVVDDLGAEHQGRDQGFALAKLYDLLNARLGKWTVLTSNLDLAALGRMDARIASRLIRDGSTVVTVDTVDFNLRRSVAPEVAGV